MDELRLPGDPEGIDEPHDVLAAEEFAMPAGPDRIVQALKSGGAVNPIVVLGAAAFAAFLYAVFRRR
jgi:hypothetical protein